tara:strand:- start:6284 stop:6715 length:432 start_codon:yes stop_codon:yes gene_type:complete
MDPAFNRNTKILCSIKTQRPITLKKDMKLKRYYTDYLGAEESEVTIDTRQELCVEADEASELFDPVWHAHLNNEENWMSFSWELEGEDTPECREEFIFGTNWLDKPLYNRNADPFTKNYFKCPFWHEEVSLVGKSNKWTGSYE